MELCCKHSLFLGAIGHEPLALLAAAVPRRRVVVDALHVELHLPCAELAHQFHRHIPREDIVLKRAPNRIVLAQEAIFRVYSTCLALKPGLPLNSRLW